MSKTEELAKMIDHSILHPTFTDDDLKKHCDIAKKYNVASVCVKPYTVKQAAELLRGTDVLVCCVIGFPHGNSSTTVKVFEAQQACNDGAVEIDMVINIGKTLGNDWNYVEQEINAVTNVCHSNNAIIKVIFETDYIDRDEDKIKLCEICARNGVDFVKTSTGYGFVKQPDGNYNYKGATVHDIQLFKKHLPSEVKIKCAGGVRTLDDLLKMKEAGASRSGATATQTMLEEAKKRYGE
jgi:deoxyribose-phosphate aldolase